MSSEIFNYLLGKHHSKTVRVIFFGQRIDTKQTPTPVKTNSLWKWILATHSKHMDLQCFRRYSNPKGHML